MASPWRVAPVWALLGTISLIIAQISGQRVGKPSTSFVSTFFVENIDSYKNLTGGYNGLFSSIQWVRSMFKYANIVFDNDSVDGIFPLVNSACVLDTNWSYPGLFASWALPGIKGITNADVFPYLENGSRRFPKEWRYRLTWAQYILADKSIGVEQARDSAAKILIPLSRMNSTAPEYARNLAFTLLHKSARPDEAMSILLQTYEQVPDPLIRYQFQNKIADLLQRNEVRLGASDSTAFLHAIGGMLESKDTSQIGMAKGLLVRLVRPEHKAGALAEAHQLAQQFKAYQQAAVGR